jgi:hypothetical protein
MQKVSMENVFEFNMWINDDGVVLNVCMVFNLFFTFFCFIDLKCINMYNFIQLCKYYVGATCTKAKTYIF